MSKNCEIVLKMMFLNSFSLKKKPKKQQYYMHLYIKEKSSKPSHLVKFAPANAE